MVQAHAQCQASGQPARMFADFGYRTRKSWSRERRIVGKAEHLPAGPNPRLVVTSLPADRVPAQPLYEKMWGAEATLEDLVEAWAQHAYTFRQLMRALRRAGFTCGSRIRTINRWARKF